MTGYRRRVGCISFGESVTKRSLQLNPGPPMPLWSWGKLLPRHKWGVGTPVIEIGKRYRKGKMWGGKWEEADYLPCSLGDYMAPIESFKNDVYS